MAKRCRWTKRGGVPTAPALFGRHQVSGFTLIEALAAMMLVAVVLPFAMRGVSSSVRGGSESDRAATATMLAQSQLEQVLLEESWLFGGEEGTFEDSVDTEATRYTWALTVEDWEGVDYRELTMTVSWQSGSNERSVVLKTVVNAGI